MARKSQAGEEGINHYGLVRLLVLGTGNLQMKLKSLSGVREDILALLPMLTANDEEPTRLANFTQQQAQLEIKTTEIGENFIISKIVIFLKPIAKSYPGG